MDYLPEVLAGAGQIWANYGYQTKLRFTAVVSGAILVKRLVIGSQRRGYQFNSRGLLITVNIELRKTQLEDAATGGCPPLRRTPPRACALSAAAVMPPALGRRMRRFASRCVSVSNLKINMRTPSCVRYYKKEK